MDAAPHSTEGSASSNPFLFSLPGAGAVDLRPVLTAGANINIIAEHLPASVGPLTTATHSRGGKPATRRTAIYYRLYRWLCAKERGGILTSAVGVQEAGLGDRPSRWWTTSPKGLGLIRLTILSTNFFPG